MANKTNRKKASKTSFGKVFLIFSVTVLIMGGALWFIRYAPTSEKMDLEDFYRFSMPEEAALLSDGRYIEPVETESPYAIVQDGIPYISLAELKILYDDGYVWDPTEGVIRYATPTSIVSVSYDLDPYAYTEGTEAVSFPEPIVVRKEGISDTVYINLGFVRQYTDISLLTVTEAPYRIVVETPGYEKQCATVLKDTPMRRFGGPKSLVLSEAKKGETVSVVEDYGKWCQVLDEQGVLGCIQVSRLSSKTTITTEKTLPDKVFQHNTIEGKVVMGWHQVTNPSANAYLADYISYVQGMNVISPTWYYLNDNQGGIADMSDASYVEKAHANGMQVWALISNFENREVDTTAVLNTTSSRDRAVDALISSVAASGADGINIDFEELSYECKDGFAQFVKEVSIKCEQNGLILSVDNYPPREFNEFYNRAMQADFADYVILMGYDEYNGSSEVPGPTASLPFVIQGVEDTLIDVPAERLILGMPFYTRLWKTVNGQVSVQSIGMNVIDDTLSANGVERSWLESEQLNYAEYMEEDSLCQIWIEDSESLSKKLALVGSYGLAGEAFWKLGLEQPQMWDTIAMYE